MTVPSIGFSSPPCHVIGIGFAEVGFVLAFGAAADFASLNGKSISHLHILAVLLMLTRLFEKDASRFFQCVGGTSLD